MKTLRDQRTYVGAAMFFERLADDEWTEDEDGIPQRADGRSLNPSGNDTKGIGRFSASQFFRSLLTSHDR